jgi:hypothetical protein
MSTGVWSLTSSIVSETSPSVTGIGGITTTSSASFIFDASYMSLIMSSTTSKRVQQGGLAGSVCPNCGDGEEGKPLLTHSGAKDRGAK